MSNPADATMVRIMREAFDRKVALNPTYVKVNVRPTKDNGYGVQVPDLSKPIVVMDIGPVRIASASSPVLKAEGDVTMLGIANDFILFGKYTDSWIVDNLVFEWNAMKFKVFKPSYNTRYDEVISIVAHLVNVTEDSNVDVSSIILGQGTVAPVVLGG